MADDCIICGIVNGKIPSKKIYEDDEVFAFLDINGAAPGHTFVVPKKHVPIFEQVPDNITGKIFSIANKISTSLFETLGIAGTNVFVTNGVSAGQTVPHFVVNVIPRKENDGINLLWKPRQLSEEEMSTVELKIKESTKNLAVSAPKEEKKEEKKEAPRVGGSIGGEENYQWRSVNRRVA